MKTGWVLGVVDLETHDQAFKLFLEPREKANKRLEDIKKKYDSLIQDRFKVAVQSPYLEIDPLQQSKVKVKRAEKSLVDLFELLCNQEPLLMSESSEEFIFEIATKHLEQVSKLLEQIPHEVVS